jgi:PhnB protein
MELNTYLSFNGDCEEAFKFYGECFGGGNVSMFKFAGSPMADQVPPEWQDKVMHATLMLGKNVLMGADSPPGSYETPKGFTISISTSNIEEAERVFQALAKQGKVTMPMQQTFWALRFGMLTDRFGIPWILNCEEAA